MLQTLYIYHLRAAVAVLAMVRSKTNAFPLSTVVIEQYRPPIDKFIIGES
jgi:ADP-ribose pyrophosphatase